MNTAAHIIALASSLATAMSALGCCVDDYSDSRYAIRAGVVEHATPPPAGSAWDVDIQFDPTDRENGVLREAGRLRDTRRIMVYVEFIGADVHPPPAELLTFVSVETGPLAIPGIFYDNIRYPDGVCGVDAVSYDLTELMDGEYWMLHHRAAIPPRSTWTGGALAWEVVDGEDVVRTTLVIGNPPVGSDGGLPDAAP